MRKENGIILALIIVLTFATVVWADFFEADGNDWFTWPDTKKIHYVTGFMVGCHLVVQENLSYFYASDYDLEKFKKSDLYKTFAEVISMQEGSKEDIATYEKAVKEKMESDKVRDRRLLKYSLLKITVGQLVRGLDSLYEDSKNRSIKIVDAIYVVKKLMQGTPSEDIDGILLYLRGGKKRFMSLIVEDKDKKGKLRTIEFP